MTTRIDATFPCPCGGYSFFPCKGRLFCAWGGYSTHTWEEYQRKLTRVGSYVLVDEPVEGPFDWSEALRLLCAAIEHPGMERKHIVPRIGLIAQAAWSEWAVAHRSKYLMSDECIASWDSTVLMCVNAVAEEQERIFFQLKFGLYRTILDLSREHGIKPKGRCRAEGAAVCISNGHVRLGLDILAAGGVYRPNFLSCDALLPLARVPGATAEFVRETVDGSCDVRYAGVVPSLDYPLSKVLSELLRMGRREEALSVWRTQADATVPHQTRVVQGRSGKGGEQYAL